MGIMTPVCTNGFVSALCTCAPVLIIRIGATLSWQICAVHQHNNRAMHSRVAMSRAAAAYCGQCDRVRDGGWKMDAVALQL